MTRRNIHTTTETTQDQTGRVGRRDLLKAGAAGLVVLLAGRAADKAPWASADIEVPTNGHDAADSPNRWAMVIDQSKCIGCEQCLFACAAYNDIAPALRRTRLEADGVNGNQEIYLPIMCQQCQNAPCVDVCPVKANHVRPDGIVTIDSDRCIGCRYCQLACPYDARVFNWETFDGDNPAVPAWGQPEVPRRPRGVVEKCNFCAHRIDRGLAFGLKPGVDQMATPACVVACPTGARVFGDLNDPDSPVSRKLAEHPHYRLREELGTDTRVYYLPPDDPALVEKQTSAGSGK